MVCCVSLKALSKLDKWTKEEVALLKYIYSKPKRNGNKSSTELTYDLLDATQTLQLIYIYLLFTEALSEASRWKFVCQEAIYKETERKGSGVPNYTRTGLKTSESGLMNPDVTFLVQITISMYGGGQARNTTGSVCSYV